MQPEQIRRLGGGVNQSGVRAFNERLLLSTLQRQGALPGSEIARRTGLSPQTVSVILRRLESDGLLVRGAAVKGRVGKPSVPMRINPRGLYSYGLKIGRRSADLILMDFAGGIRAQRQSRYRYPTPGTVFGFVEAAMAEIEAGLRRTEVARICGIGIAAPHEIWSWHEQIGAPEAELRVWRDVRFDAALAGFTPLPVFAVNDATAACRAEHMFGQGKAFRDYAYFFLAAFVGGGVVLNHSVYEGAHGNAGALGSLPALRGDGRIGQLLDIASLHLLEPRLAAAGLDPETLWQMPQDWSGIAAVVDPWIETVAEALARASLATCAVIDFEAIVIDGALPETVRADLVARVARKIAGLDTRGLILPQIRAGAIGAQARALGAASGPVLAQFLMNTHAGFAEPGGSLA